jgi:hypothetical protein
MAHNINYVIEVLNNCSYDDLGASRPFLIECLEASENDPKRTDGLTEENYEEHVREQILSDLLALRKAIPEHLKEDFCIIMDDIGFRHGHFNVMRYIFMRWYLTTDPCNPHEDKDKIMNKKVHFQIEPKWFIECAATLNQIPSWNLQTIDKSWNSKEIVDQLIKIIAPDSVLDTDIDFDGDNQ